MLDDVRISAVIPTYNRAHLIKRTIESVLSQTTPAAEIIVVDDGSQDDTRQQVAAFGDRVTYVRQQNAGAAVARNHGFEMSGSEWVALLDSDDIWLPEHLERAAQAISDTKGVANYYFADTIEPPEKGGGRLWDYCGFQIAGPYELTMDGTDWVMMWGGYPRRQPMMLQSTTFKKSAFLACGGFMPVLRYRDDTHLFLKLGIGAPICAVAGCGVKMTADDMSENRLTLTYDHHHKGYLMQVIMYWDMWKRPFPRQVREEFRKRLAMAHRSLGRLAWDERRVWTAAWRSGLSALLYPSMVWQRFRGNRAS